MGSRDRGYKSRMGKGEQLENNLMNSQHQLSTAGVDHHNARA